MRPADLEFWVLQVLDRVAAGSGTEDARIELKRDWPKEPFRTARRLAAHANSARCDQILWLIGVNERTGPVGASHHEISTWWPQILAEFDGIGPAMISNLAVQWKDVTVHALLFDTSRAPYLVLIDPAEFGGKITEVPWREGTAVRSARREDLVRLLIPVSRSPDVELMDACFEVERGSWRIEVSIYVTPANERQVVIPFHRCEVTCSLPPYTFRPGRLFMTTCDYDGNLIKSTTFEVIIGGPGQITIAGSDDYLPRHQPVEKDLKDFLSEMSLTLTLSPSQALSPIILTTDLHRHLETGRQALEWRLSPDPFRSGPEGGTAA